MLYMNIYFFICVINVVSICSSDVGVYLHIEQRSEIQSQEVTQDAWRDVFNARRNMTSSLSLSLSLLLSLSPHKTQIITWTL